MQRRRLRFWLHNEWRVVLLQQWLLPLVRGMLLFGNGLLLLHLHRPILRQSQLRLLMNRPAVVSHNGPLVGVVAVCGVTLVAGIAIGLGTANLELMRLFGIVALSIGIGASALAGP
jgi:hypothetical protein